MDQIKIGRFIAECRKEKGLTQVQLSEKLGITNRAVSKWENGKSLPDASIMVQLCEVLGISVNELLNGEKVATEKYEEIAEKNLTQIVGDVKKKSSQNRIILTVAIVLIIVFAIFSCIAGAAIGEDIGKFIYNVTH